MWRDEGRKEGLEEEAICFGVEEERMEKRLRDRDLPVQIDPYL